MSGLTVLEICAGAGGQALGLEQAGFEHVGLVEIDQYACGTLRINRPAWEVYQADVRSFDGGPYRGVDLLAGGVPCPPFSVAGKQLGHEDERDLFPAALRLVDETRPRAVMLENVRGLLAPAFQTYRDQIIAELESLGYRASWRLLNACDYGVSQLRPRVVLVAIQRSSWEKFDWPTKHPVPPESVGDRLFDLMSAGGWEGAEAWRKQAAGIAPTIVGGSTKHGGPDLGPVRARKAWRSLGVDGLGIADQAPQPGFRGMPKLTVRMVARLQGFPDDWLLNGRKTAAYRQVGNAFPPPVAWAVGDRIANALGARSLSLVSA